MIKSKLSFLALCACTTIVNANPKVFLTPLQCQDLGNLNSSWSATKSNIHGVWWNNAGNSHDETRRILNRIQKQDIDIIIPVSFGSRDATQLSLNTPAYTRYETINELTSKNLIPFSFVFDALVVAEGDANLHEAIDIINEAEADPRFLNMTSGVIFSPRHGLQRPSNGVGTYLWRTTRLIDEVNGYVGIECAPWRFAYLPKAREGFLNIYDYARNRGLKFVWLMNRGVGTDNDKWIDDIDAALNVMDQEGVSPDIISISNQGDTTNTILPTYPEKNIFGIPQNTVSGGLYKILLEYGWLD